LLRMLRRAAPIGLLMLVFLQGTAMAATVNVSIASFAFSPDPVTGNLGTKVIWTNNQAATPHTTTSDTTNPDLTTGVALWNSPTLSTGQTFKFTFVAGSFPYHCNIHPFMHGTVQIKPSASPVNGHVGQTFRITYAPVDTGPKGFVFDIQKKDPAGSFTDYMTDVGTKSVTFVPTAAGTYQFQVRLQRVSTGGISLYSPPVSINVTA
jgi:plastocyanin